MFYPGLPVPVLSSGDQRRLHQAVMPIVVPTWYDLSDPDQVIRYKAFRETLHNHIRWTEGYPLLVVDASPDAYHQAIRVAVLESQAVFVDARVYPGLARQNLVGLMLALRYAQWVGRIEPEKSDLARATAFDAIVRRLQSGVQLVCLGRDGQAMGTLPAEQRVVEQAMNDYGAAVYGLLPDPSCGPRFLGRSAMQFLARFDIARFPQWQWQLGLLMELMQAGKPVEQFTVNLRHPRPIRYLEEGNPKYISKRRQQGAAMLSFINTYADEIGLPVLAS